MKVEEPNELKKKIHLNYALCMACYRGQIDSANLLIESGALVTRYRLNDSSPLTFAIVYNQEDIVSLLLSNGAPANDQDHMGYTSLMFSVMFDNPSAVSMLLIIYLFIYLFHKTNYCSRSESRCNCKRRPNNSRNDCYKYEKRNNLANALHMEAGCGSFNVWFVIGILFNTLIYFYCISFVFFWTLLWYLFANKTVKFGLKCGNCYVGLRINQLWSKFE